MNFVALTLPLSPVKNCQLYQKFLMSEGTYELIILGGGPAGYAAGIRAGQLGKKAVVIEMERAGGTCLNWGCIPSKALLKSAETFQNFKHAEDFGISCGDISYDFEKIIQRSRGVADQMGGGIEFLFKKNKVDYLPKLKQAVEDFYKWIEREKND